MRFELKSGKGYLPLEVPSETKCEVLVPEFPSTTMEASTILRDALDSPIASPPLRQILQPSDRVVIVTSDITRPMPSAVVLPFAVDELRKAGVPDEQITVVLALGSHRAHSEEERRHLVGDELYDSPIQVIDSDAGDCVHLGTCAHGTPVDIFRKVVEADRIVALGNIEYHYFAGYSGGAKALMPGVSSWAAIQANHKNMIHPGARAGALVGNPVREDIDQITDFIPIDFLLNVVLDPQKNIVAAFAGDVHEAHRAGCAYLDTLYGMPIEQAADIVVVSPGGHPKDLNLYQAQKALDNAKHAVAPGGIILLVASAAEGFGEKTFERWMLDKRPEEMVRDLQEHFVLGGHKAAAIGQILLSHEVYLVSDLSDDLVRSIGFVPFADLQNAFDLALAKVGPDARVILMPAGGSTLPLK